MKIGMDFYINFYINFVEIKKFLEKDNIISIVFGLIFYFSNYY